MIKQTWTNLVIKLVVWLIAEIVLTFLGLDNLADYGEFILAKEIHLEQGIYMDYQMAF